MFTLEAFGLAEVFRRLTEQPIPPTYKPYIEALLYEGDNDSGVLDGCVSKDGLSGALRPSSGAASLSSATLLQHFTPQQLEEGFTLVGSRRIHSLPPPRPPLVRAAERTRLAAQAAQAAVEEEERRQQDRVQKRGRLEAVVIDEKTQTGFVRDALMPLLLQLNARRWEGWPLNDGNPFTVKFTRQNCAKLGLPDYFAVVKEPMDLTRIDEKLSKSKYRSIDAFVSDVRLMVSNAQAYNREGDPVHSMAGELLREFEAELLPLAQHSYQYMVNAFKKRAIKEEAAMAKAMYPRQ